MWRRTMIEIYQRSGLGTSAARRTDATQLSTGRGAGPATGAPPAVCERNDAKIDAVFIFSQRRESERQTDYNIVHETTVSIRIDYNTDV
ncbi:hypothetical protein EVAR_103002_1 [Eumeta japonica]|uniref:Uncharacterized protein n=1 Tax=Eumeta variegata TaxID=151549 RepID=A0A4C1UPR0_EUMVA|nr:hypothetical protein EVAR_103002_1 [Eumeta japonica]